MLAVQTICYYTCSICKHYFAQNESGVIHDCSCHSFVILGCFVLPAWWSFEKYGLAISVGDYISDSLRQMGCTKCLAEKSIGSFL